MERLTFYSTTAIILLSCLTAGLLTAATGPEDVIKQSNQEVLDILKKHPTLDKTVETQLLEIIGRVTDFAAISGKVIQRQCKKLSKEQCKTFDNTFQRLLRVSSIKKMGRYRAERFDYLGKEITGNSAVVRTMAYYEDEQAQLDYHLEKKEGQWKIVNYVVDDIDTVRNYKKQFLRLFAKKSFPQVIERLQKKITNYEKNR